MSLVDSLTEKVRKGDPLPFPLGPLLTAATPVTRIGMWTRKHRKTVHVDAHVISIGNITAGGTGKTPAVLWHLERLKSTETHRVAVLTRGYATGDPNETVVSSEVPGDRFYEVLGDEPALILQKHPGVLVIKGRDRVASAKLAVEHHGCETLILDDGFQYLRLQRDINQLVVDATNPFGNGRLVPRGILREPLTAIARATEILITRCDLIDPGPIEKMLRNHNERASIRRMVQRFGPLRRLHDGETVSMDLLGDAPIDVACAIGNPDAFVLSLEVACGATVAERHIYRDHARWDAARLPRERVVVTTEKDAVRMREAPENLYVLEMRLEEWNDTDSTLQSG